MGGTEGLRLLLDTHIILWSAAEPEKLSQNLTSELQSDSNELWYSPISVWEILLLAEKDRISLGPDPVKAAREIFRRIPLKEAVLNKEVAIQSRLVQLAHQDPADRFLAATAVVYNLTLVTADSRLLSAKDLPIMAAP
jgi:PIN domain nuclease of toxin-antitoxin system